MKNIVLRFMVVASFAPILTAGTCGGGNGGTGQETTDGGYHHDAGIVDAGPEDSGPADSGPAIPDYCTKSHQYSQGVKAAQTAVDYLINNESAILSNPSLYVTACTNLAASSNEVLTSAQVDSTHALIGTSYGNMASSIVQVAYDNLTTDLDPAKCYTEVSVPYDLQDGTTNALTDFVEAPCPAAGADAGAVMTYAQVQAAWTSVGTFSSVPPFTFGAKASFADLYALTVSLQYLGGDVASVCQNAVQNATNFAANWNQQPNGLIKAWALTAQLDAGAALSNGTAGYIGLACPSGFAFDMLKLGNLVGHSRHKLSANVLSGLKRIKPAKGLNTPTLNAVDPAPAVNQAL